MDNNNPFENPVSKDEFNGFWIPHHNAKVMKRGLEENKAPFLPDETGNIKAEAIYNAASGYCLPAGRLIPVQFAKMDNGYSSNVVIPRTTITAMEQSIKENEKGVFFNYKDEEGEYHVGSLFFPEQTQDPNGIVNATKDKLQQPVKLNDTSLVIASSEPKEYLGSYIAACRSGMKLSVDPQIAEEFKGKIMPTLNNDIRDPDKRDKNIPSLSNVLFEAEKRGTEICRTLEAERNPVPEQKKKQPEMEMCF